MFLFDFFYEDDNARAAQERAEVRANQAQKMEAVDWHPDIKFAHSLKIRGASYSQPSLFEVDPCPEGVGINNTSGSMLAISPSGNWCYRERYVNAGSCLAIFSGRKRGEICFDSDVLIPMIHGKKGSGWTKNPWMSFTPMEFFTLRPGTKLARGHTIVAGLGMGHQLEQVCKKRNVKKVTLIEKDKDIVDWVLPKVDLHGKDVEVVIGDANDLVPKMKADVALIDIYPGYGGNGRRIKWRCHNMGTKIDRLWIWGSA